MRSKLIGLCLVLIGVEAFAQGIQVRGAPSCGGWVSNSNNREGIAGFDRLLDQRWLVGYLSGLAIAEGVDSVRTTDNESIFLWMDNYCKTNPLRSVSQGGFELHLELVRTKGLKR